MKSGKKEKNKKKENNKNSKKNKEISKYKTKKKSNFFSVFLNLLLFVSIILTLLFFILFYSDNIPYISKFITPYRKLILSKLKLNSICETLYAVEDKAFYYITYKDIYDNYGILKRNKDSADIEFFLKGFPEISKLLKFFDSNYLIFKDNEYIYVKPIDGDMPYIKMKAKDYAYVNSILLDNKLLFVDNNDFICILSLKDFSNETLRLKGMQPQWVSKERIAYIDKGNLNVYNIKTRKNIATYKDVYSFFISPHNNYALLVKNILGVYKFYLLNLKTNEIKDIKIQLSDFKYIKWSYDERFLYILTNQKLFKCNRDGKDFHLLLEGNNIFLSYVCKDGQSLYFLENKKKNTAYINGRLLLNPFIIFKK